MIERNGGNPFMENPPAGCQLTADPGFAALARNESIAGVGSADPPAARHVIGSDH